MKPMVTVENLQFTYNGGFSLRVDELSMEPGTVTAVLGPNGSGKSTLFSLLRGRQKARSGRVLMNGRDIARVGGRERAALVGLVPQLNESPFGFSVEEVIGMGFFRKERGGLFTDEERSSELDGILERMDLKVYRNRNVNSLSGGEYQRVLLGRVLAQDPGVLLLDEPANHLDLKHQTVLLRLLREEAGRGKTVITILHDINQALLHADRVVLLKAGRCVFEGPAEDVITPPRIREVYGTELDYYYPGEGGRPILGPGRNNGPV